MKNSLISISFITVILLTCGDAAQAQKATSASLKSYAQAREVLEAGIIAMGGLEALRTIQDVTREMSGIRSDAGQGMSIVPLSEEANSPPQSKPTITSVRDLRGQRMADSLEATIFGGQPLRLRTVRSNSVAFTANMASRSVYFPPTAAATLRTTAFRRYPESLLQTVWMRPETLRWLGEAEHDGRKQRVISFADTDGVTVSLYFDALTNLLTKTEVLIDDQTRGDAISEIIYTDWRAVDKVVLPFKYTDRIAGSVLQEMNASSIKLDTRPADTLFTPPDGFGKTEAPPQTPTVKKLADDVYAILGSYNSIFVVFKEYVLVVEAGDNNRSTELAIAEIKKIAPDKPIRYLVSTHFHFDHLGGVRSYIAEGTTMVTTPMAKTIIERAASATHLMRPDALSRKPQAARFETVKDKRVFDDGTHRIELYEFASPHCGEMIIAYLPKEKILVEGDLFDTFVHEGAVSAVGEDTLDLAERIKKWGLQVETIVPVHGRLATIEDLRRTLAGRTNGK